MKNCNDVRAIVILYLPERKHLLGLIPNNQNGFMERLRKVYTDLVGYFSPVVLLLFEFDFIFSCPFSIRPNRHNNRPSNKPSSRRNRHNSSSKE